MVRFCSTLQSNNCIAVLKYVCYSYIPMKCIKVHKTFHKTFANTLYVNVYHS